MKDIFISYASEQTEIASNICNMLEKDGLSAFIALRDITPGAEYASEIMRGINDAKIFVLILSKESNESPHVLREIERAVDRNIPIIVYPYEAVSLSKSLEYFLMSRQWLNNMDKRDELLLDGVHSLLNGSPIENNTVIEQKKKKKTVTVFCIIGVLLIGIIIALILTLTNKKENTAEDVTPSVSSTILKLGDTLTIGKYNDEPIEWRVLHLNDDGTAVLIADKILSIKAFDTAECGKHNNLNNVDYWSYENTFVTDQELLIQIRGNNEWAQSNIRTWLNSDAEIVEYKDQAPTYEASVLHQNSYSEEPGFLHFFTDKEKAALVVKEHKTKGNALSIVDGEGNVVSSEAVFLLAADEMSWFDDAGISWYGEPTEKALEIDETNVKGDMESCKSTTYDWWLRDPGWDYRIGDFFKDDPELSNGFASANIGTIMSAEYRGVKIYTNRDTGVCVSYGIRPAITINIDKLN